MEDTTFWNQIELAVRLLKNAHRILFISGAGLSADSGLPTYRGVSGLYNDNTTHEGFSIETALSGSMFKKNPAVTWKYISQIEETCRGKSYNRAHEVLAQMETCFEHTCILTQNVDGFHHRAGSSNIIDIHGNLHSIGCTACSYQTRVDDYSRLDIPPACPCCSSVMRPDIVLFDETLSDHKIMLLSRELEAGFDLVFSIGTTSIFPYIAQPVIMAYYHNIPIIEINPTATRVSKFCHLKIAATAAKTLNAIWLAFNRT